GSCDRGGESAEGDQSADAVTQVGNLVGMPLVAEDEDGEEDEGGEHRGGAQASGGKQDRPGGSSGGNEYAGRGQHVAHCPPFGAWSVTQKSCASSGGRWERCRFIAPGGTSTRP